MNLVKKGDSPPATRMQLPRLTVSRTIDFTNVPDDFTIRFAEYLNKLDLESTLNVSGGNIWTTRQGKRASTHYPIDDVTLSLPHDPMGRFYGDTLRTFFDKMSAAFESGTLDQRVGSAAAYVATVALFGDTDSAFQMLGRTPSGDYQLAQQMLRFYYVAGHPFLQQLIRNPTEAFEQVALSGRHLEVALQNAGAHIPAGAESVTKREDIVGFMAAHYKIPDGLADVIVTNGNYKNLMDALCDVGESKVGRMQTHRRIMTLLYFNGDYDLTTANTIALRAVSQNMHHVMLNALTGIEAALSNLASHADEQTTNQMLVSLTRLGVLDPLVAETLTRYSREFEKVAEIFAGSPDSSGINLSAFVEDKSLQRFILSQGALETLGNLSMQAGIEYARHVLQEIQGIGFNTAIGHYARSNIFSAQKAAMKGRVDSTDVYTVLGLLPRYTAAAYLAGFLYHQKNTSGDNIRAAVEAYKKYISEKVPQVKFGNTYYLDGLSEQLFGGSTESPLFIQMYDTAKNVAKERKQDWVPLFESQIKRFYSATKEFLNPRRAALPK